MKAFLLALLACFASFALCSCGTLESDASFPKLEPEQKAYADALPEGNSLVFVQGYGKAFLEGSKSASLAYPCFPWFEVKSLFKDERGKGYGLLYIYAFMPVVPLFAGTDGTLYDPEGEWSSKHHFSGVPLLYSYAELVERTEDGRRKDWQFDLVDLPWLDGLAGFGSGYFQFLWIPFYVENPSRLPKSNIDVDFKPGKDFDVDE